MSYTCHKNYDPYYGFKIIQVGTVVIIKKQPNGLARIETHHGHLLGMIHSNSVMEHFVQLI